MPSGGHGEPGPQNPGSGEPDPTPPSAGGSGGAGNEPCKEPVASLQPGSTGNPLDQPLAASALPNGVSTPIAWRLHAMGDPTTNGASYMGPGGGGSLSVDPRTDLGRLSGRDPHTNEPSNRPGNIPTVGTTTFEDIGAYALFHPMAEGFAAVQFRPQCWVRGAPNMEHNPQVPGRFFREDERVRPQVLTMRAFGALSAEDYDYVERPLQSRARGGTGNGGVLLSPPRFEMEDYLDIGVGASTDVDDVTSDRATDSLFMFAPGVRLAIGKPNRDGSAQDGAGFIQHSTSTTVPLKVTTQVSGASVDLMDFESDGGEVTARFSGTSGIVLPAGGTSDRPTTVVTAGMMRWNDDTATMEVYDGSTWQTVSFDGGGGGG